MVEKEEEKEEEEKVKEEEEEREDEPPNVQLLDPPLPADAPEIVETCKRKLTLGVTLTYSHAQKRKKN
jgi:hypothetical protein